MEEETHEMYDDFFFIGFLTLFFLIDEMNCELIRCFLYI